MERTSRKAYGPHFIAAACQVSRQTVGRWIAERKLPHYVTAGGHRRVWGDDLVAFLRRHNIPVPPEIGGGERVLIVDDDAGVRRVLRRVLAAAFPEAELFQAEDGFDAGRKLAELRPALVFLDNRLPGVDGCKLLRRLREDALLKPVRVVAMSGYDVEDSRRELLAAGADEFLAKPLRPEEIEAAASRALGRSHAGLP